MVTVDVLRAVLEPDLVATHPNLAAYAERGVAQPAFERAMAADLADPAEAPLLGACATANAWLRSGFNLSR